MKCMMSRSISKSIARVVILSAICVGSLGSPLLPNPVLARNTGGAEETKVSLAGLNVTVWKPATNEKAPLVIFSHGFGGTSTQSRFLMQALAAHGYLVVAPNHKDAFGSKSTFFRPQVSFKKADQWSDSTYLDRHDDIVNLIHALHKDATWDNQIDWSKLALCGHSLGGYTALGLGGAWPKWKIDGVKAIIALSPYCHPYLLNGSLSAVSAPVMYQGGTRDFGITPTLLGPQGAFAETASPAYLVEFQRAGHLAWTNFNRDANQVELIDHYCLAFLDKYVRHIEDKSLDEKAPGVVDLETK